MTRVNCTRNASEEGQLACLRNISYEKILSAMPKINLLYLSEPKNQIFSPVFDGRVIKRQIWDSYGRGEFNKVPFLIGSNRDEGLLMVGGAFSNWGLLKNKDIIHFILTVFPNSNFSKILEMYPETEYEDFENPVFRRFVDIWTDIYMNCPLNKAIYLLEKRKVSVFRYFMTHIPKCPFRDLGSGEKGVSHDDQIYFVFNKTKNLKNGCEFTEDEKVLSNFIGHSWSNMALFGYPKTENGETWKPWNPYEQETMFLDVPLKSKKKDFSKKCSLFMNLKEFEIGASQNLDSSNNFLGKEKVLGYETS